MHTTTLHISASPSKSCRAISRSRGRRRSRRIDGCRHPTLSLLCFLSRGHRLHEDPETAREQIRSDGQRRSGAPNDHQCGEELDEELQEVFVGSRDDLLSRSGGAEEGAERCLRSAGRVDEVWRVRSARRLAACGDRRHSLFRSELGGHCGAAQRESDREGGVLGADHGHHDPQRACRESGGCRPVESFVGALSFPVH